MNVSEGRPPGLVARWLFFTLCGVTLLPLVLVTYPPAIDLAQHGGQIALALRYDDAACGFDRDIVLNWHSPYLLGNLVALGFAQVVPVLSAIKLTLGLSILGVPLAFLVFVRAVRAPRAWAFLGLPLAYSFAVHWGFFIYAFAIPLALLYLSAAVRYGERPTRWRTLGMALFSILLFFAHALAAVFCGGIGCLVVWARRPSLTNALRWSLPLAAAAPLAWQWAGAAKGVQVGEPDLVWSTDPDRFLQLFSQVVGASATVHGVLFGLAVLAVPWLAGAMPSRRPVDWIPLYFAVLWCIGAPGTVFGTALVYGRMHVFLPALMLLAMRFPKPPQIRGWRAVADRLPIVLAVVWIGVVALQWAAFERESAGFRRLLAHAEPARRAYSVVVDAQSRTVPGPVYLQFPVWYLAQGGCLVEPSFARAFPSLARYRPGHAPGLPSELLASNQPVRPEIAARYGYLIVRAQVDPRHTVLAGLSLREVASEGEWWLFEPLPRPGTSAADTSSTSATAEIERPRRTAAGR